MGIWRLLVGGVVVMIGIGAVLVLSGAASGLAVTHTVLGTIELTGGTAVISSSGNTCAGYGSLSDVTSGTVVSVEDDAGRTLDTTEIGFGHGDAATGCAFDFQLHVPDGVKTYTFSVGERDGFSFSHAELDAVGWAVRIPIGG